MKYYHVKSPILFLVFNRPDVTKVVFEQIKAAKPGKLYIAGDGPRPDREKEDELCRETQAIVTQIDWDCEVKTLFRNTNLGCKDAISSAISWFFDNEEEGIILEDDCLPATSFFYYCDTVLEKYRDDARIRHIAGCNLQMGKKWGDASTYFAHSTAGWGWASWRRVWKDYDKDLKSYEENELEQHLNKIFTDHFVIEAWAQIFKDVKAGKIDTWDYQLAFLNYFNNSLSVNPNVNLVSNIGFGNNATHTMDNNHIYAKIPLQEIAEITYPKYMLPEKEADHATFVHDFDLEQRWRQYHRYHKPKRRFVRWLKQLFK